MREEIAQKYATLRSAVERFEKVIVAFSGGIDSSLVAYVAAEVLGDRALAITSGSPSLKRSDLSLSETLAQRWGMQHEVIVTDELSKPDYRANPVDRCFHCKTSLYDALSRICEARQYSVILNGTNCDDLGDHRPGLIAAENYEVVSPLVEAGFHKADIRELARELGLENADKPQAACLSSRFPYGSPINEARLSQVEAAENILDELGFSQYRVRHHDTVARLEILPAEFAKAIEVHNTLQARIKACGYQYVALDLGGFRSGSLNEGLIKLVNVAS